MPRRLSKEESRKRYAEGRKLWNDFDPIGVSDDVDDEYDSYVGPCLRIAEAGQGQQELVTYVRWVVFEHMGMSETAETNAAISSFADAFTQWFRTNWLDTIV